MAQPFRSLDDSRFRIDWHLPVKNAESSDWVDRFAGLPVADADGGPKKLAFRRAELVGGTFADSLRLHRPRAEGDEAAGGAGARIPFSFSGTRSRHLGGGET
jgi:hypothetical protein